MRTTLSTLVGLALLALTTADPVPQGVTSAIVPSGTPPAACSPNYDGVFEISTENVNTRKRDLLLPVSPDPSHISGCND